MKFHNKYINLFLLKRCLFIVTFFLFGISHLKGQIRLQSPIKGFYVEDYIKVNYVDWGIGVQEKDGWSRSKTYNGHEGTNFTIRDIKQMESTVHFLDRGQ